MEIIGINEVIEKAIKDNELLIEMEKQNKAALQKIVASYGKKRLVEICKREYKECPTKSKSKPLDKVEIVFFIIQSLLKKNEKINLKTDKPIYFDLTYIRELKALEIINQKNFFNLEFSTVKDYERKEEEYITNSLKIVKCDTNIKRIISKIMGLGYLSITASQLIELQNLFGSIINKTSDKEDSIDQIMLNSNGDKLVLKEEDREFRTSLSYLSSAKTMMAEHLKYLNAIDFLKFYVKNELGEFKEVKYEELKYQKHTYIRFN